MTSQRGYEHAYAKPPIGLRIEEVAGGLDQAWEFGFLPGGKVRRLSEDDNASRRSRA